MIGNEDVFGLEVAMVDVLVEEVAASLCELEKKREGLSFRDVAIFFEIAFEVAD